MEQEQIFKPKPGKSERILRITLYLLVIAVVLLLGTWAAKLYLLAVR